MRLLLASLLLSGISQIFLLLALNNANYYKRQCYTQLDVSTDTLKKLIKELK